MDTSLTENPLDRAHDPKERTAALLRFGIFVGLAILFGAALVLVARGLLGSINMDQVPSLGFLISAEAAQTVATVLIPSAILAMIYRESRLRFGFGRSHRLGQLALGIVTGLLAMSALIGLMALFGGVRGWTMSGPPGAALLNGLVYTLSFTLVAISEEGLLRGYALVQLSRAISFWPAAIVTSVIFVALHLVHATESVIGLAQVGLIGLILAYSVRRTGAIWFALGCHGAWDFAETYVYGVPDSGVTAPGALSNVALSGPAWLTGGVTGPEASWLIFPVFAGMALVVRFALPRWR
jgi:membrane protease YdiL (CAAX protease family)